MGRTFALIGSVLVGVPRDGFEAAAGAVVAEPEPPPPPLRNHVLGVAGSSGTITVSGFLVELPTRRKIDINSLSSPANYWKHET